MILSTTKGLASVLISPSSSKQSDAIFRSMRRIILPDLVLGKSLVIFKSQTGINEYPFYFIHKKNFLTKKQCGIA